MLVPKLKQTDRPELVLLPPPLDEGESPSNSTSHVRLRLRKWETRRTWSGRALIASSFPMAYLLIMLATGMPAPVSIVRLMIGIWVIAMTAGAICAEAVWRHRTRLEQLVGARLPGFAADSRPTH